MRPRQYQRDSSQVCRCRIVVPFLFNRLMPIRHRQKIIESCLLRAGCEITASNDSWQSTRLGQSWLPPRHKNPQRTYDAPTATSLCFGKEQHLASDSVFVPGNGFHRPAEPSSRYPHESRKFVVLTARGAPVRSMQVVTVNVFEDQRPIGIARAGFEEYFDGKSPVQTQLMDES